MQVTTQTVERVCEGAKRRRLKAKIVLEMKEGEKFENFIFDGSDANTVCFRELNGYPARLVVYTVGKDITLFPDGTGVLAETAVSASSAGRYRTVTRIVNVHYPVF